MALEKLTRDQQQLLKTVCDEWVVYGLADEPADRPEAAKGITEVYTAAGLEPPETIMWVESPHAGLLAANALSTSHTDVARDVWGQQWGVRRDLVEYSAEKQVNEATRNRVASRVEEGVYNAVEHLIQEQIKAVHPDPLHRDSEWHQMRQAHRGQHDAGWLAIHAFWHRTGLGCSTVPADRLTGLLRIARSAGWWWAYKNIAVIAERPTVVRYDDQQRLHSEGGPAIAYPDGWCVWLWHGSPADSINHRDEAEQLQQQRDQYAASGGDASA